MLKKLQDCDSEAFLSQTPALNSNCENYRQARLANDMQREAPKTLVKAIQNNITLTELVRSLRVTVVTSLRQY